MSWIVSYSKKAAKHYGSLPPVVQDRLDALTAEIELLGPVRGNWKNYSKLEGSTRQHHCHIKTGRPTYVAVWEETDKQLNLWRLCMQAHMKKHPTENLVPLHLMVHPANVSTITRYVETLEKSDSIPWREVAGHRGSVPSSVLRGCRSKSEMTQTALSELTGIPQRHISEMEQGKRTIGRENAKKLAKALETDYRMFL